jgi:2-oxoglutarate dehydrogenase E1 component
VINNQVGFTTSPQFARSSPYPSDVAKAVQAPILHVNGDDPEAVTFACKLAIEFRQKFKRDVVIDMWCYRRFGHNEGDEPSFTQPLMYAAIRQHPPISEIYGTRLLEEGVIDERRGWTARSRASPPCSRASSRPRNPTAEQGRLVRRPLGGPLKPSTPEEDRRNGRHRGRRGDRARCAIGGIHRGPGGLRDPQDAAAHPRRQEGDVRDRRGNFDWATGEALAFGTLLREGHPVRLSGQDSGRGTFSQRHSVWVDQTDGRKYIPLTRVAGRPLRGARQPALRSSACSASNTAGRSPIR